MRSRPLALACLLLAAPAVTQVPPAPKPEFGAYADRVLVDVVVTDKRHRPVLDLLASDFEVYEDGKRRDVISFAAFGAAAARAREARAAEPVAPLPADAPQFVRAATVLLVDEGHLSLAETARLGPVLTRVMQGLTERTGALLILAPYTGIAFQGRLPEDAMRLAEVAGHVRGHRQPMISTLPMTDSEALEILAGQPLTERRVYSRFDFLNPGSAGMIESMLRARALELAAEATARRRDTFGALKAGLDWLEKQPGRHSVLMVTSGFTNDPAEDGFREIATRSLRINAPIHFLDVSTVSAFNTFESIAYPHALPQAAQVPMIESMAATAGSERVADNTGGLRIGGSDLEKDFERVLDTTRTYYVLGYDPPRQKKPGFRKIEVRVERKGARVLARKGYFDDAQPAAPRAP
ncbi:MAG: VWA domain-containing protein [Vicinamibacteria bacterium]|nr:VWA domain-containing protein [Vicinamibacteria bacterium]